MKITETLSKIADEPFVKVIAFILFVFLISSIVVRRKVITTQESDRFISFCTMDGRTNKDYKIVEREITHQKTDSYDRIYVLTKFGPATPDWKDLYYTRELFQAFRACERYLNEDAR